MRKRRVLIYGGTDLPTSAQAFVTELSRAILRSSPTVIVTGGFLKFADSAAIASTDFAALKGARKYARAAGISLRDCFEAWLPSPELDRNREKGGVLRMSKDAYGITVRLLEHKSALGRRLSMVHDVDVVLTIRGKRHTNEVLEQALELNVPALPLPFAGGDSRKFWKQYSSFVVPRFALDEADIRFLNGLTVAGVEARPRETASEVASLVARAKFGRCLVLLPFDKENSELFDNVVRPAVEDVMVCDRLDRQAGSNPIRTNFVDAVDRASAVIADVTALNPNVMYEIGYVLAKGLAPMFYCRAGTNAEQLPVYLRDLNIAVTEFTKEGLGQRIRQHLAEVKSAAQRGRPSLYVGGLTALPSPTTAMYPR